MPFLTSKEIKQIRISDEDLRGHCEAEGIDFSKVCVLIAQWAESGPRSEGSKSALVAPDLIVRSNGTTVYLDGILSMRSRALASLHEIGQSNPQSLPWDKFVASITLPEDMWPK